MTGNRTVGGGGGGVTSGTRRGGHGAGGDGGWPAWLVGGLALVLVITMASSFGIAMSTDAEAGGTTTRRAEPARWRRGPPT